MGLFKAQILMNFFSTPYRVYLLFFILFFNIYDTIFIGRPFSFSGFILEFLFLIILIESVGEIILNSYLNKKQLRYIKIRFAIITAPIVILTLISSYFLDNPTSLLTLISMALIGYYTIFGFSNSTRYSFISMWMISFLGLFWFKPELYVWYSSLFLSTFIALFFHRNSENNPNLFIEDEQIEKFSKEDKKWLDKIKGSFFKTNPLVIFENNLYFKSNSHYLNEVGEKINNKRIINNINKLLDLKKKFLELRLNSIRDLYKRMMFGFKFPVEVINKVIDRFFNEPRKVNRLNWLKFTNYNLATIISILLFNRKMAQRVTREVYENYEEYEKSIQVGADSKFLWLSDMQINEVFSRLDEDLFKILKMLSLFDDIPSFKKIEAIKKFLKEHDYNKTKFNYKKIIEKRIKEASRLYKNRKMVMKSFTSLGKRLKTQDKFNKNLKLILE